MQLALLEIYQNDQLNQDKQNNNNNNNNNNNDSNNNNNNIFIYSR